MKIEYENEEIEAFILYRKAKDKRYKRYLSDSQLLHDLDKVIKILQQVEACDLLLNSYRSLNFERLKHNLSGQCSVRIGYSSKYRLIFTEKNNGVVISLIEISEHYGDK